MTYQSNFIKFDEYFKKNLIFLYLRVFFNIKHIFKYKNIYQGKKLSIIYIFSHIFLNLFDRKLKIKCTQSK